MLPCLLDFSTNFEFAHTDFFASSATDVAVFSTLRSHNALKLGIRCFDVVLFFPTSSNERPSPEHEKHVALF